MNTRGINKSAFEMKNKETNPTSSLDVGVEVDA